MNYRSTKDRTASLKRSLSSPEISGGAFAVEASKPEPDGEIQKVIEVFENYLSSHNLKLTAERLKVVQKAWSVKGDLITADELYLRLHLDNEGISKATLYRTIDLLTAAGVLKKLKIFGSRGVYYERSNFKGQGYRYHLVCEKCGKISEFSNSQIDERLKKACGKFEFAAENFNLIIYGTCQGCQEKN